MESLKSFSQLSGGTESEPTPELQQPVERKEKHIEMLEKMGLSPEDSEKIPPKDFFDLAMNKCGYMAPNFRDSSRRIILMSTYQKAFIEYYGLKGPKKNVEFSKIFDKMYRDGEIDFIPHTKGKDSFLASPIVEE
ncbi:MAG: hypothetical protein WCQ00_02755 [bacterium]